MKRPLLLPRGVVAPLAFAVALAGCGGSAEDGSAQASAAAPPLQAAEPARAVAAIPADPYAGALVNPRTDRETARLYVNGLNLFFDTKEEMLEALAAYAMAHPRLPVIRGYGWRTDVVGAAPSPLDLDSVVRDRPVILLSADLRSAWRNSRALGLPLAVRAEL